MITDLSHLSNESICERSRRLAREDVVAKETACRAKRQAFLDNLFKPDEYTFNEDGTYTICGWRWQLWIGEKNERPHLTLNELNYGVDDDPPLNVYRGVTLPRIRVNDELSLGKALREIDEHIAFIDRVYPDTVWGRFRLWLFN